MPDSSDTTVYGVLAEFADPGELMHAAEKVRDAGFSQWDVHSPFPVHGMDKAMGLKPSGLGGIAFIVAVGGGLAALGFQCWVHMVDYPLSIAGKPLMSIPAFIPITFEVTILSAAFATVFGMFALNKLPRLHHPLFYSDRFAKATDDAFFISIEAKDDKFDPQKTVAFLKSIGGTNVELLQAHD